MYEYVEMLIYKFDVDLSVNPLLYMSSPINIILNVSIISIIATINSSILEEKQRLISKIIG